MRYAKARFEYEDRDAVYRIYVTDTLRALLRNKEVPRYADLIDDNSQNRPEKADTVINRIKSKLKG